MASGTSFTEIERDFWAPLWQMFMSSRKSISKSFDNSFGISHSEYILFFVTYLAENKISLKDLAETSDFSLSRVSRMTDNLVSKNLMEKVQSETDGRVQIVSLTHQGLLLLDKSARATSKTVQEKFLSEFTEDEMVLLTPYLNRLRKRFEPLAIIELHLP
jgi:DNA-binding MarR family transcriptional regulator